MSVWASRRQRLGHCPLPSTEQMAGVTIRVVPQSKLKENQYVAT